MFNLEKFLWVLVRNSHRKSKERDLIHFITQSYNKQGLKVLGKGRFCGKKNNRNHF